MRRRAARAVGLGLVAVGALGAGCAGGQVFVSAPDARYPVSMSRSYVEADGDVVVPRPEELVEHFEISWRNWTLFWTLLPLSGDERDLSRELDAKVEEASGVAIVNLKVTAKEDPLWFLLSLVPIYPSSVGVVVRGDVVRLAGS